MPAPGTYPNLPGPWHARGEAPVCQCVQRTTSGWATCTAELHPGQVAPNASLPPHCLASHGFAWAPREANSYMETRQARFWREGQAGGPLATCISGLSQRGKAELDRVPAVVLAFCHQRDPWGLLHGGNPKTAQRTSEANRCLSKSNHGKGISSPVGTEVVLSWLHC